MARPAARSRGQVVGPNDAVVARVPTLTEAVPDPRSCERSDGSHRCVRVDRSVRTHTSEHLTGRKITAPSLWIQLLNRVRDFLAEGHETAIYAPVAEAFDIASRMSAPCALPIRASGSAIAQRPDAPFGARVSAARIVVLRRAFCVPDGGRWKCIARILRDTSMVAVRARAYRRATLVIVVAVVAGCA